LPAYSFPVLLERARERRFQNQQVIFVVNEKSVYFEFLIEYLL